MFTNKNDGKCNLCGDKVRELRKSQKISQKILADNLSSLGLHIDKNAIQRIECGLRFVPDVELKTIARYFKITSDELMS